jgi:hypothetical protein
LCSDLSSLYCNLHPADFCCYAGSFYHLCLEPFPGVLLFFDELSLSEAHGLVYVWVWASTRPLHCGNYIIQDQIKETHILRLAVQRSLACVRFATGTVRLKLYKGNVTILGRKSPYSLYDKVIASFEDDKGLYNQVCFRVLLVSCKSMTDVAFLYKQQCRLLDV